MNGVCTSNYFPQAAPAIWICQIVMHSRHTEASRQYVLHKRSQVPMVGVV